MALRFGRSLCSGRLKELNVIDMINSTKITTEAGAVFRNVPPGTYEIKSQERAGKEQIGIIRSIRKLRIFCPMRGEHFDRIKEGKRWEFRKWGSPVHLQLNKVAAVDATIEFRRGYSGKSIFARIKRVRIFIKYRIPKEVLNEGHISKKEIKEIIPVNYPIVAINFELVDVM